MKSVKITLSALSLGLFLSLSACNSNKTNDDMGTSADSSGMDNMQNQMESDTMSTDSAGSAM